MEVKFVILIKSLVAVSCISNIDLGVSVPIPTLYVLIIRLFNVSTLNMLVLSNGEVTTKSPFINVSPFVIIL